MVKARIAAFLLLLPILAGCYSHSFPTANSFIRPAAQDCDPVQRRENCLAAHVVQVFADANGTFYPSGWRQHLTPRSPWPAGSLLNESVHKPALRGAIDQGERELLDQIERFTAGRERIFILIHGYNNTVPEAFPAYAEIERRLDLRPRDGVIHFYWDGLTGRYLGGGKIWFNAAGNSQLVGSRALRRILNRITGKDVYLIGHSRAASVMLSALADPVYDPDFLRDTRARMAVWPEPRIDLFSPEPFTGGGKRLHILVAAPAVDRIDFCDARHQPTGGGAWVCPGLRALPAEVVSFHYTVNPADQVLNKYAGLSRSFNPTGLGARAEVGEALDEVYPVMRAYHLAPPTGVHRFLMYVRHACFAEMLRAAGLERAGSEPAEGGCRRSSH